MTRAALMIALWSAAAGCTQQDDLHKLRTPERATFELAGDVLHNHCGSLDCHGDPARGLRIYGGNGMRADGISGQGATTEADYDATFESVVLFEPEVMHSVVSKHGEHPERLTMIQKGRGAQVHKGGVAISEGSDADDCVVSWLSGAIDEKSCNDGAELEPPPAPES